MPLILQVRSVSLEVFTALNPWPQNSVVCEETSVDEPLQCFIRNPALDLQTWETEIVAYYGSEAPVFATDEEGSL